MQSCPIVVCSVIILATLLMGRCVEPSPKMLTQISFCDSRLQEKDPARDVTQWDLSWYSFGTNQQLFDLGFDRKDALRKTYLNESIAKVDEDFDLVMITERMHESLVLLADALCIPLESVAVLKNLNERPKDKIKQLTQKQEKTLQKFLLPDQMLYDHFKRRLENRIRSGTFLDNSKLI